MENEKNNVIDVEVKEVETPAEKPAEETKKPEEMKVSFKEKAKKTLGKAWAKAKPVIGYAGAFLGGIAAKGLVDAAFRKHSEDPIPTTVYVDAGVEEPTSNYFEGNPEYDGVVSAFQDVNPDETTEIKVEVF